MTDTLLQLAGKLDAEAVDQAKNAVDDRLSFEESLASAEFAIKLLDLAAALRARAAQGDAK